MNEETVKIENQEPGRSDSFPYPKLIQTFNYLFPKEKGAPDIFTMENLKKFSRYAPYFTIAIFAIIFSIWAIDMQVFIKNNERSPEYGIYIFVDAISLIAAPIQYLWWLGTSLFAKLVKRSPAIPLVMSFFSPLRTLGLIGVVHFFGFILAGLYRLGNPL